VRFGLALPHYAFSMPDGATPSIAGLAAIAQRAEELGFSTVYVSDHLFLDITKYGGPPGRNSTPEAFGLLHAVAAATSRINIGTLVLCAPFRNDAVLELQVKTLQEASGDRFICGLGAGWYEDEFEYAQIPFLGAGPRIDAMIATAERVFAAGDAPVIIGGKGGPRILDAVARTANGWNVCWRSTPEFIAERREQLEKRCSDLGRDPSETTVTVGLYTLLGRDQQDLEKRFEALRAWAPGNALEGVSLQQWSQDGLVGTIDSLIDTVRAFEQAGVSELIVSPASLPFALFDSEQLDLVAELAEAVR
jgi:alkanesulfonate monooxygenase SsuD/methylene tetrahydromethanopterin reductase-like flavin-dependent oxidoreductase (luciferase family)